MTIPAATGGGHAGKAAHGGPGTAGAASGDDSSPFARALGLAIEPLRAGDGPPGVADAAPGTGRGPTGKPGVLPGRPGEGRLYLPDEPCLAGPVADPVADPAAAADDEAAASALPSPAASDNLVVPWLDLGPGLVAVAREFLPIGDTTLPATAGEPADAGTALGVAAEDTGARLPAAAGDRKTAGTAIAAATLGITSGARRTDAAGRGELPAAARRDDRRGRVEALAVDDEPRRAAAATRGEEPSPRSEATHVQGRDAAGEAVARPHERAHRAESGLDTTPARDIARPEATAAAAGPAPTTLPDPSPAPAGAAPAAGTPTAAADPAPTEVQLPTPMGTPEFMPRLGAELTVLARDGVQHARVHVNPAEMGPIAVQLTLDGQQAQVSLVADNALTRQLLEQQMPSLAAALRENGLTLTGGGVFEQPRQAREQADGQRQGAGSGTAARREAPGVDEAGEGGPAPARRMRRQGVVDLYA